MSAFARRLELLVSELGADAPSLIIDLARADWGDDEDLQEFIASVKGVG